MFQWKVGKDYIIGGFAKMDGSANSKPYPILYWTHFRLIGKPQKRLSSSVSKNKCKTGHTVAGGKSGKTPGRNFSTRTVVNLRNSLVHFFHKVLGEPQYKYKNRHEGFSIVNKVHISSYIYGHI
jgi:hypothetical protein